MGGLSLTLEIAKKTLLNTQVEINTTSHNISNADTEGYARQTAVQTADYATRTYGGWIGNGSSISSIVQSRDQFIEAQLRDATSNASKYSTLASQLKSVQSSFSDDGSTGISEALGKFWDSWDQLSQNAEGVSEQTSVYATADNLAETIRTSYEQLSTYATDTIPSEIEDTVKDANSLIHKIADYNTAILKSETSSSKANDLRDARYQALTELSALIPVDFTEDANGIATLTTTDASGTVTLVTGGKVNNELATDSTISGGKLGGLRESLDDVNSYMDRLNSFAEQLITNVNQLHAKTTDGTNDGPEVFTATGTDYAATITASTDFLSGQDATEEASRAVALSGLQDTNVTFTFTDPTEPSTTSTLSSFLSDLQERIGSNTEVAKTRQTYYGTIETSLSQQQQSVSGVSLDEELVQIIKLQHIYQAAAKIIDATSSLLDTVVSLGK
ncbi:MAG: flagellar hook-associated protein FlgK [Syntrophobacter sp.]